MPPDCRRVSMSVTYVAKSHVAGWAAVPSHALSVVALPILSSSVLTAAASALPAAAWNVWKEAMTAFFGITMVVRSVTRNGANFDFRVKTTVDGSGLATEATLPWMSEQKLGMNVQLLELARSNVNLTSSDVKSSPFCHLMP